MIHPFSFLGAYSPEPNWMWWGFLLFILVMLILDLGVFHRRQHSIGLREAAGWSIFWIALALGFNAIIYYQLGQEKAIEFLTGYVLEKSLSIDNLFVFLVIFSFFNVRPMYQHRVLYFGILGAVVLRGAFIVLGATLINRFHFVLYLFGALLLLTAYKLLSQDEEKIDPSKNPVYRFFRRIIPSVEEYHGSRFFVRQNGKLFATPLFFVLIAVEVSDVIFAVDSIPAVFAVTQDPFIVFTSNIFAILGLRALFFLVSAALRGFVYLKPALAIVLAYIGVKIMISHFYKVPVLVSLAIVIAVIGTAIVLSLLKDRRDRRLAHTAPDQVPITHPKSAAGE